MEMPIDTL